MDFQLKLTADERSYLVELLQNTLKEVRVEEHRTRSPSFRENIIKDEEHILAIQKKLQQ